MAESDGAAGLEALLGEERTLLRAGDIDGVLALAAEKARLLESVDSRDVSVAALTRLKDKAAHNGRLLAAALDGMRSVAARLHGLGAGCPDLLVYGNDGRSQTVGARTGAIRRA